MPNRKPNVSQSFRLFSGGGKMAGLIENYNWSTTELGPISSWPNSLTTAVKIMLGSRYAMFVWWGPNAIYLYNDAYAPTLGVKHPNALGKPAKHVWPEIWDVIKPMFDNVLFNGTPTYSEKLLLFLERTGFKEETYHTFSYSPIPDDEEGVGGLFCAVAEVTEEVLGTRRLATLKELSDSNSKARTQKEVCNISCEVLAHNPNDIPFVFLYLIDEAGNAILKGTAGIPEHNEWYKILLNEGDQDPWCFKHVIEKNESVVIENIATILQNVPQGPWDEKPAKVLTLPIPRSGQEKQAGFLVTGISSRLELDENYKSFLRLVTGQLATALSNVRFLEEERKRAEALAEIDKAKTVFFSNVSHEFRTPLTLMLGPLENLIQKDDFLNEENKESIEIVHRNSLRLLKLVNSLLDFSRIEAGRLQASFEATDLRKLTIDLSSSFRSALESAGLQFNVNCQAISEEVYVDTTMWERIVFNLLSNAFKFTFKGSISVSLVQKGKDVELSVQDTGTGIPIEELPKLFSRFHRVENAQGRTHEGSGIGLAMVYELVKLHKGNVTVHSEEGKGTTFTVTIPIGKEHLTEDSISEKSRPSLNALPALTDELVAYKDPEKPSEEVFHYGSKEKILIADDNSDMREYIRSLLRDDYHVICVRDGIEALESIKNEKPSLVLSDIMMPNMDGIGLLNRIRADERTSQLPVIFISARAGEEAKVEGIRAGADDYLIKPFSARELLARVKTNLDMARARKLAEDKIKESEQRFRAMADKAPMFIWMSDAYANVTYGNMTLLEYVNQTFEDFLGLSWENFVLAEDLPYLHKGYAEAFVKQRPYSLEARLKNGKTGEYRWFFFKGVPRFLNNGELAGYISTAIDINDLKKAQESESKIREELEAMNEELRAANDEILVRNDELSRINEELTRINSDLDNFVYTASHDLKAPVSNIEGLIHSLMDVLTDDTKEDTEVNFIVDMIHTSINRFKNTIHNLTEISKLKNELHDDVKVVAVSDVINNVKILIQDLIEQSGAIVRVDTSQCESIHFSESNLQSVIYNLVSNAIKYRSPDRTPIIHVESTCRDNHIILRVSDNGLGMAPQHLPNIFKMFKRVHHHVEGTGVGLYLVKRIVHNAHGSIEVESEVDRGTSFTLYLPDTLSSQY